MKYADKESLKGLEIRTVLFSQYGDIYNKKITIIVCPVKKRIRYNLENNGALIYSGPRLDDAISIYNQI